jgi:hypothetical protein
MESVNDLLDYVERGRAADWLAAIEGTIGRQRVRVVSIKVLSWLKSQNHLRTKRALDLNMAYPWCAELATVLAQDSRLAGIFVVAGNTFDFREEVSEELRNEIRAKVDADHNPRLMALK